MLRINKFLFALVATSSMAYAAYAAVTDITQTEYTHYSSGSDRDSTSRTSTFTISDPQSSTSNEPEQTQTPMMYAAAPTSQNDADECYLLQKQPVFRYNNGINSDGLISASKAEIFDDSVTLSNIEFYQETSYCEKKLFNSHPYKISSDTCKINTTEIIYNIESTGNTYTQKNISIDSKYCTCPDDYYPISHWSGNNVPIVTVIRNGSNITDIKNACFWDDISNLQNETLTLVGEISNNNIGTIEAKYLAPLFELSNLGGTNVKYPENVDTLTKCSSIADTAANTKVSDLISAQNDNNNTFKGTGSGNYKTNYCANIFNPNIGYEKAQYIYCDSSDYPFHSENCGNNQKLYGDSCYVTGMSSGKSVYKECLPECPSYAATSETSCSSSTAVDDISLLGTAAKCWDSTASAVKYICSCATNLKTKQEYCDSTSDPDCMDKTLAIGVCKWDSYDETGIQNVNLWKFLDFAASCDWYKDQVSDFNLTIQLSSQSCKVGEYDEVFDLCKFTSSPTDQYKVCRCPEGFKSKKTYCSEAVASNEIDFEGKPYTQDSCEAAVIGIGDSCTYDGSEDAYASFMGACPLNGTIASSENGCSNGAAVGQCYDVASGDPMYICGCPSNYKTLSEFCLNEVDAGREVSTTACEAHYIGIGTECTSEKDKTGTTLYKYPDFGERCSYYKSLANNADLVMKDTETECTFDDALNSDSCYEDKDTIKYICRCPDDYQTLTGYCTPLIGTEDPDTNKLYTIQSCGIKFIGTGKVCTFDGYDTTGTSNATFYKYKNFAIKCLYYRTLDISLGINNTSIVSDGTTECLLPDNTPTNNFFPCYTNATTLKNICRCPETWLNIVEFCNTYYPSDADCKSQYIGLGTPCTFEGGTDYQIKYASYLAACPTDREIYDSEDDCVNGEVDYHCSKQNKEYVVCKCKNGYQSLNEFCDTVVTSNQLDFKGALYTATTCAKDYIPQGELCTYDNSSIQKYQEFIRTCPTTRPTVTTTSACRLNDGTELDVFAECLDNTTKKYVCSCPSEFKTLQQYCTDNFPDPNAKTKCLSKYIGNGSICRFDNNDEDKYGSFLGACPDGYEFFDTPTECTAADLSVQNCKDSSYSVKYFCACPTDWIDLDTYCQSLVSSGVSYQTCIDEYKGSGTACTFETGITKYAPDSFFTICPTNRTLYNNKSECKEDEGSGKFEKNCSSSDGTMKYLCSCPDSFMSVSEYCAQKVDNRENDIYGNPYTQSSCEAAYTGSGTACYMEGSTPEYQTFSLICPTGAETYNSVDDCGDTGELNYTCKTPSGSDKIVCKCKSNFVTQNEYCQVNNLTEEECKTYKPSGIACSFDGENKYAVFASVCPEKRPLFSEGTDCAIYNGELDFICEYKGETKVVCKCPSSYVEDGSCTSSTEEVSGKTCNLDNTDILKYEFCRTTCSSLSKNGSMTYNYSTEEACKTALGSGATFGTAYADQKCSENNELKTPCYCGSTYKETCKLEDLLLPDPNASLCKINGIVHYEYCIDNSCSKETSNISVISYNTTQTPTQACISAGFGPGAIGSTCGINQVECYCNPAIYNSTCEVPYQKPYLGTVTWCKAGKNGTKMSSGEAHFKLSDCLTKLELAPCGQYIINENDGTPNYNYTLQVVDSSAACASMYGTGASAQLCEYLDIPGKRAYNCYYNPSEFTWTEYNCPVRHVLGDKYIIKNGVRYYDRCDCHTAYKYHQYNCGGTLSGRACAQELSSSKIKEDSTLQHAINYNLLNIGDNLSFYAYCSCSPEYNQTCTGTNEIGVGAPCNGKYKSCICEPDPLPENWTDNYYGCPDGQRPTGVTKPNGCGGKYYQCKTVECTWQHTEKCLSPLIGIDPCQDNSGNIVAYKSCRCPDGYVQCPTGFVGEGIPCMLNGEYYYKEKDCVEKNTCSRNQTATCYEAFQLGINPCEKDGGTYFEYCTCANGFDKICTGENEIGIGEFCELDGVKYYKECKNPYPSCTPNHKYVCDTNQTSFDPCVNSDNDIMYKCRCPSNWQKCTETGPQNPLEVCTDENGTVYSSCAASNQCTEYQINSYSICTQTEIGMGGSCSVIDSEGNEIAVMHAKCEPTSDCAVNGYKYTCLTHDENNLGDYCVDANGNRLYKSCSCPINYVSCNGENNIKGASCASINQNGEKGETLYSSCTCNKDTYRYQCEKTETNQGVIPLDDDFCQENIYGAATQPLLYRACGCEEDYKFTCSSANQIGDENNYCDTGNGGRRYKSCSCPEDWTTCPSDTNTKGTSCTPINADGSEGTTVYKTCSCDASYKYSCGLEDDGQSIEYSSSDKYILNNGYCTTTKDGVTTTRYQKCQCSDSYNRTCTGVSEKPTNPDDYCISVSENGSTQKLYQQCQCSTEKILGSEYYDGLLDGFTDTTAKKTSLLCENNQLNNYQLRKAVEEKCGHSDNATFTTNGCGRLYFKCLKDKSEAKTCSSEHSPIYAKGFCGAEMWAQTCNCNSYTYSATSPEQCITTYQRQSNFRIYCTDATSAITKENNYKNTRNCSHLQLTTGKTCTDSAGVTHYQCRCATPTPRVSEDPNSCISSYCGDPSIKNDAIACWEGWDRIGVLIISGNKDPQDKACNNYLAENYSQLVVDENLGEPEEELYHCDHLKY